MNSIARNVALEMALRQRSIGRRIAQIREQRHLTQEAAADRAGVTLRAYQKWEAGGGIQYANLQRLATALGVTVEQITGDETAAPDPFSVGRAAGDIEERLERLEAMLKRVLYILGDETDDLDLEINSVGAEGARRVRAAIRQALEASVGEDQGSTGAAAPRRRRAGSL